MTAAVLRARAPLRISFAGGGTDVSPFPEREGGAVLSSTINRYAFGSLVPSSGSRISIESLDYGVSLDFDRNESPGLDGRLDLAKVAIRRLVGDGRSGFRLFLHSNAPPGSGLGSSSAMIVAVVGLLRDFTGVRMSSYEIAKAAYLLERVDLGIAGGRQDQYASTFGGFNFIEFGRDYVVVNPLRIASDTVHELEHNMVLCYTGNTRESDGIISDQTARYESAEYDAVSALRSQKALAEEMKRALLHGRLSDFGHLMGVAWQEKKAMSPRITTPFIDELYDAALREGALGGKVTGAGGGGFMMFYCEFTRRHRVVDALVSAGASVADFGFDPAGLCTWRVEDA